MFAAQKIPKRQLSSHHCSFLSNNAHLTMDSSSTPLWTRRSNSSKLSLSMSGDAPSNKSFGPPSASNKSRGGDTSSHSRHYNPFSNVTPLVTALPSPSTSASTAFGLGSGAFAAFSKTPTRTNAADKSANNGGGLKTPSALFSTAPIGSVSNSTSSNASTTSAVKKVPEPVIHQLKNTWVVCVEDFWTVYTHLRRPNTLPHVSDYHVFKKGIRPVWEDQENRNGGKWIIRLKKGVSTRYWEELLLAIVGDQLADTTDDLCGVVLSIRSNEDVLSVWTKVDGAPCLKIKHALFRKLGFPADTQAIFKTHASSIEAVNNKTTA